MSGPMPVLTPESAPRDLEKLLPLGIYMQKRLAEELENRGIQIFNSDKDRSAFYAADSQSRAQRLLDALHTFDNSSKGAAPVRQPAVPAAAVSSVVPITRTPARQPHINGAAVPDTGAAPVSGVTELLLAIKGLRDDLAAVKSSVELIAARQNKLIEQAVETDARCFTSVKMHEIEIGILALFGEQVLGAPKEAFMPEVIKTCKDALLAVGKQ